MNKKLKYIVALSLVLFAVAASACTLPKLTNVNGIIWQYCPETGQVAVGNNGPASINVDFSVYYAEGGIPGHWQFTIAPGGGYVTVPSPGTAVGVVVNAVF